MATGQHGRLERQQIAQSSGYDSPSALPGKHVLMLLQLTLIRTCMQVAPVPMEEHARWRFLLNADGQGASWRLAKLLAIDSVVLKFQSTSIEYYYRSLVQVRQGQERAA